MPGTISSSTRLALSVPCRSLWASATMKPRRLKPANSLPLSLLNGLDSAPLKKQRLTDNPDATTPTTYFHWIQGGVDFIYLDNATFDQFSPKQLTWLEGVLERASSNPSNSRRLRSRTLHLRSLIAIRLNLWISALTRIPLSIPCRSRLTNKALSWIKSGLGFSISATSV